MFLASLLVFIVIRADLLLASAVSRRYYHWAYFFEK